MDLHVNTCTQFIIHTFVYTYGNSVTPHDMFHYCVLQIIIIIIIIFLKCSFVDAHFFKLNNSN